MPKSSTNHYPSRRQFCQAAVAAAMTSAVIPTSILGDEKSSTHNDSTPPESAPANPDEAIQRLLEGNRRFAEAKASHPHESKDWRSSIEGAQHPWAVILGCADSRVCPELLFDQGLGDLFVIRVAGNIVDVDVAASIEYAVHHLHTKLVMVLGHSNCGAVTATLDHLTDSATEPEDIVSLLYRIEPALEGLAEDLPREERISVAVERNVRFSTQRLTQIPDLRKSMKREELRIVGGVYDMHTGKVALLKP